MIKKKVELIELKASAGMTLTDGKDFTKGPMYVGVNDSPENWTEITDEEAAAKIAEQKEEVQEDDL